MFKRNVDMRHKKKNKPHRIVVHFKDGRLVKGYTTDFIPARDTFHLTSSKEEGRESVYEINCTDLKAIFFVRTLEGNRTYVEKKKFDEVDTSNLRGLKIKVEFSDGEVIRGMSFDYSKNFNGFFIKPVDPEANNGKVYVIADNLHEIQIGSKAEN